MSRSLQKRVSFTNIEYILKPKVFTIRATYSSIIIKSNQSKKKKFFCSKKTSNFDCLLNKKSV